MNWRPLPDPAKPQVPYFKGFKANISTHNPSCKLETRPKLLRGWLEKVTHSQLVLEYPPLETPSPQHVRTAGLTILKTIDTWDGRGAQLAICSIDDLSVTGGQFEVVAKIFDAFYYPFEDTFWNKPMDVTKMADEDYTREATAYNRFVDKELSGSAQPKYFGSWTFTLPFRQGDTTVQRPVRLVLIECLAGPSMYKIRQCDYNKDFRFETLAMLMDGITRQEHIGVYHNDLSPRNTILVPWPQTNTPTEPLPRVVLIDYNMAEVRDPPGRALPLNPMELFWRAPPLDFRCWIPIAFYEHRKLWQEWLVHRFGGEESRELYASPTKELEFEEEEDDDD